MMGMPSKLETEMRGIKGRKNPKVNESDYGKLPPKKLARMKALLDKGLKEHGLSLDEQKELWKLYKEAGGI